MTESSFVPVRSHDVASLNLSFQEYVHASTGARHFHLDADDDNNAFLVAFLTVPRDSTGVAHILEHTSLCGSERFPVRDPFFMMIRRSLNTFMNAFTASDWTAYPFASQNRKDFDNLLQVYLDAVFFPRLDPLDFAQEGHRLEFDMADDPDSDLTYKGVVFNEMKGAMSSPVAQLWQAMQSELFPTVTYHHNSGGDPEHIPSLGYEDLRSFHARHYHPSNAVFMTYGNFPVAGHQANIERLALARFERAALDIGIPDETRYPEPRSTDVAYPLDPGEAPDRKSHVLLGWLLGHSADLREMMNAHLLSGVLLDNSASPLRRALETSDLGASPSELCDLDDSTREAVFVCGLEGCAADAGPAVERLVLDVLEDVARNGVPAEQVESVLHQVELAQREIGGGRFPYGLQLMVRGLPAALHGGDPAAVLDIDPVLAELRESIRDPAYIRHLTRRVLLDNPHRVCLTMHPDPELAGRRAEAERERLAQIKTALSETQRTWIVEQAAQLKQRQEQEDDASILPRVGLEDVPATLKIPTGDRGTVRGLPVTTYAPGTNGILYEQLVVDLPSLDDELIDDLPLYCDLVTEVGCGELDYLQAQARQAAVTGGVSARTSLRASVEDVQRARGVLVLSGKALERNHAALAQVLGETFESARFDELPRLRELVAQLRAHQESQVTDQGHLLALTAATSGMGPCGVLGERWGGLDAIARLKRLDDALGDEADLKAFSERLTRIRDALRRSPRQLLVVADRSVLEEVRGGLDRHWSAVAREPAPAFAPPRASRSVRQAWSTSTQVNFCARAYPTVCQAHPDAAVLTVLGNFMRNGFLHRAIREQGGAYGAGASYSPDTGAFRMFSYRDPRIGGTFSDFDASIRWVREGTHEPSQLEEAILGVVGEIDRPESPAGDAAQAFFGELHGRDAAQRRRFREAVLGVSLDALRQAAATYLVPDAASEAVVGSRETLDAETGLDMERRVL